MSGKHEPFSDAQLAEIRHVLGLAPDADVTGADVLDAVRASRALAEAAGVIEDELEYIRFGLPLGFVRWTVTLDDVPQPPG